MSTVNAVVITIIDDPIYPKEYPKVLNTSNFIKVITTIKPPIEFINAKLSYSNIIHPFYSSGIQTVYGINKYNELLLISKNNKPIVNTSQ